MKLRKLKKSLKGIAGVLALLFITACIPTKWSTKPLNTPSDSLVRCYVVSHGYHTSVVIPAKSPVHDWRDKFPGIPQSAFFEIAWGDEDFYQKNNWLLFYGIKAVCWPTGSVMHVVGLDRRPRKYFYTSKVFPIKVPFDKFREMRAYIEASFRKSEVGDYHHLGSGLYGESGFYESGKLYHGLYNCNNWVVSVLRRANKQTPLWGGFPFMITMYL